MKTTLFAAGALSALALLGCTSEVERYDAAVCACQDLGCVAQADQAIGAHFASVAPDKLVRSLSERDLAALDHARACREKLGGGSSTSSAASPARGPGAPSADVTP